MEGQKSGTAWLMDVYLEKEAGLRRVKVPVGGKNYYYNQILSAWEMLKSLTGTFVCSHWEVHASKQWQESIGGEVEQNLCVYLFAR